MLKSIVMLCMILFAMVTTATNSCQGDNESYQRPRQFRMQIYSKPNYKGTLQSMRASNGSSTPCWNLSSKIVGSFQVNDPLVKVAFYRSTECKGKASAVFTRTMDQNHVMLKAKSVSITKVKLYKDQCSL